MSNVLSGSPDTLSATTHALTRAKLNGLECIIDLSRKLQGNVKFACDTQCIPGLLICAFRDQERFVVDFLWADAQLLEHARCCVRNSAGKVFESNNATMMNGGKPRARMEFSIGEDVELNGALISFRM